MAEATELVEVQGVPELEENRARRAARINRPKWEPKKWHPVYEEIVLLDCLGYKGVVIAEMKGLTPQHVSNVLNTPQAKMIREITIKRMQQKRELTIEQRLEAVTDRAMSRIEEVVNNDELAAKNPLGLFDRAITVLKATNKIKEAPTGPVTNNMIVSDAAMDKLLKAVEKSDQVKALHSGLEGKVAIELPPKELVNADVPS